MAKITLKDLSHSYLEKQNNNFDWALRDVDKLGMALGKLAEEDPTFQVKTDEASGQTIISGMGELHLDILVDRLKREFKVEVNQGKPQVEYKEAITASADHREVYKKQSV